MSSTVVAGVEYIPMAVTASVLTTLVMWVVLTAYMASKSKSLAGGLIGSGALQLLLSITLLALSAIQYLLPTRLADVVASGVLVWIQAGLAYAGWTSAIIGILSLVAGAIINILTGKYESAAKLLKYGE